MKARFLQPLTVCGCSRSMEGWQERGGWRGSWCLGRTSSENGWCSQALTPPTQTHTGHCSTRRLFPHFRLREHTITLLTEWWHLPTIIFQSTNSSCDQTAVLCPWTTAYCYLPFVTQHSWQLDTEILCCTMLCCDTGQWVNHSKEYVEWYGGQLTSVTSLMAYIHGRVIKVIFNFFSFTFTCKEVWKVYSQGTKLSS